MITYLDDVSLHTGLGSSSKIPALFSCLSTRASTTKRRKKGGRSFLTPSFPPTLPSSSSSCFSSSSTQPLNLPPTPPDDQVMAAPNPGASVSSSSPQTASASPNRRLHAPQALELEGEDSEGAGKGPKRPKKTAKPVGSRAITALLHKHDGDVGALLDVIETHVGGFEKQNCAMAFNR